MSPAAGQEHGITGPDRVAMKALSNRTVIQPSNKLRTSDSAAKSHINLRARIGLREIPHLSLRLTA